MSHLSYRTIGSVSYLIRSVSIQPNEAGNVQKWQIGLSQCPNRQSKQEIPEGHEVVGSKTAFFVLLLLARWEYNAEKFIGQQIIPPTTATTSRFFDLIRRLLAFDPEKRLTVEGALSHPFFSIQMYVRDFIRV